MFVFLLASLSFWLTKQVHLVLGDPREDLFFFVHLVSECLRGSSVLTKVETSLTKKKKKVKIMEVALLLFEDLPCFFLESFLLLLRFF